MPDWTNDVPRVADGYTTFSATGLNPIVDALTERTDYLKDRVDNLSGARNCGLIYTDTGFDASVPGKGTVLAFVDGKYVPAKAVWSSVVRSDGSVAPASEAYIVGVLISEIVNGYGTIMSCGWTSDPVIITSILGSTPSTGQYFLGEDGGVVLGTDSNTQIPIYCLTYCGTADPVGKLIFNPALPEYSGHSHGVADLPWSGWSIVGNTSSYFIGNTGAAAALLGSTLTNYTLVSGGDIVDPSLVHITGNTITVDYEVQSTDKIRLYSINPMQGRDPLIHTVTVDENSGLLSAENINGNVVLGLDANPASTSLYSGSAVVSFDGNTYATGPVVQGLLAGPGITLRSSYPDGTPLRPGVIYVGNANVDQSQIDINVTNLDGVLFGTDPSRVTYKFPAGVTSSMYGTVRIPSFDAGMELIPILNLLIEGNGSSIPSLGVEATLIPMPEFGGGTSRTAPSTVSSLITEAIGSSTENYYYKSSCTLSGISASPDALLTVKITGSTMSSSVEVVGISIQLVGSTVSE